MKLKSIILTAIAFFVAATACDHNKESEDTPKEITLSKSHIDFTGDEGQSETIEIQGDIEWAIEGYSEGVSQWLEVDKLSGTGSGTISIRTIAFNPYDIKRMAVLTFRTVYETRTLVVKQDADPTRTLSLSADTLKFGGPLEEKALTVQTSKAWTLVKDETFPEWLEISPESGSGETEIKCRTIEMNEEIASRSVSLCFRIDKIHSANVAITQAPGITFAIDKDSLAFGATGSEKKTLSVSCNSATKQWNVIGYTDAVKQWLTIDKLSGTGNGEIAFTTIGTNADLTKEANLQIKIDDKRCLDLYVCQASGLEINVSSTTVELKGTKDDSQKITITTNTSTYAWTIDGYTTSIKEWLSIDKTTATGLSTDVSFTTLSENKTGKAREAVLKFVLSTGVEKTITVKQAAKAANVIVYKWTGKSTQTLNPPTGETYQFPFTTASAPGSSTVYTEGKNGEDFSVGYFKVVRSYVATLDTGSSAETAVFEFGPTATADGKCYYANFGGTTAVRMRNTYIKSPAIPGYRLSGIEAVVANSASTAAITISTDDQVSGTSAAGDSNIVEGKFKIAIGKTEPLNITFSETTANTSYYMNSISDRIYTSITFKYIEVE